MKPAHPNLRNGPDFLVIGAARSGTTWMHANLVTHPDIRSVPVKEIGYWNSPSPPIWNKILNYISPGGAHRRYREFIAGYKSARAELGPDHPRVKWLHHYFYGRGDLQWYLDLFLRKKEKFAGDLTPAYSLLPLSKIRQINQHLPQVKIVYILRNPVERHFSHFIHHYRQMDPDLFAKKRNRLFRKHLNNKHFIAAGDYAANLARWKQVIPDQRMFICYFDQLKENPTGLADDLANFIGIRADLWKVSLTKKRNSHPGIAPMTPEERRQLFEVYKSRLAAMADAQPNDFTRRWLEDAE